LRQRQRRADRGRTTRLGEVGRPRVPHRPGVAVPLDPGAAARIHRTAPARTDDRVRDRRVTGIRAREVVAPSVPQPASASHQGRAAVQAEHRGDERAVPPAALAAAASCLDRTTNAVRIPDGFLKISSGPAPHPWCYPEAGFAMTRRVLILLVLLVAVSAVP